MGSVLRAPSFRRAACVLAIAAVGVACSPARDTAARPGARRARLIGGAGQTPAASPAGNVVTYPGTTLGLAGFSANGRIQPHGAPAQYYFEYGPTTAYGSSTPVRSLGPKLAAFYRETWDKGTAGWRGGEGDELVHHPSGGASSGFVRFGEPSGTDYNHVDGVGPIHLTQYFYPGFFDYDAPSAALGGSNPDMRDAKVRVVVRGNTWRPRRTELVWWSQIDTSHGDPNVPIQFSNWAHTGASLTDALLTGNWETVEYRLWNDTTDWTYAGTNREIEEIYGRSDYVYRPLDEVLGDMNTDFFHVLAYAEPGKPPVGSIDYDEIEVVYRNHSLVFPSNGGTLVSAPPGSSDPSALTDGWRVGAGKTWTSGPSPQGPQEIVYAFANPVTIDKVQLHQNPEWPSQEVEVQVSSDGLAWDTIVADVVPPVGPDGPNLAYLLVKGLATPATMLKVRILSGARPERWGLGEIEVFGSGAVMQTDDDWYRVNEDITGLAAGQTVHYRLVAVTAAGVEQGGDLTFVVPPDTKPEIVTGAASRLVDGTAKVEARINSLGVEAQVYFEYGPDTTYGSTTDPRRAGPEITPRTFVETLPGLTPGDVVHFRAVGTSAAGTTYGDDATFIVDGPSPVASPGTPSVQWMGRFDDSDPLGPRTGSPGARITASFDGTDAWVSLTQADGALGGPAYLNVIVDGASTGVVAVSASQTLALATGLAPGAHTVAIQQRNEPGVGTLRFEGFSFAGGAGLLPPPPRPRRWIELIGDSLLDGRGVDGDRDTTCMGGAPPELDDAGKSVGALAAQLLAADWVSSTYAGKGLARNADGLAVDTIPTVLTRTLPNGAAAWPFFSFVPDVVVVALGASDFDGAALPADFTSTYDELVTDLHLRYGATTTLLLTVWSQHTSANGMRQAIEAAIDAVIAGRPNADRPYNHKLVLPEATDADQTGCLSHPNAAHHAAMAQLVANEVRLYLPW